MILFLTGAQELQLEQKHLLEQEHVLHYKPLKIKSYHSFWDRNIPDQVKHVLLLQHVLWLKQ